MKTITQTTNAGVASYTITAQQFTSVAEAREAWQAKGLNADDTLLSILNAAQLQNAKQGPKGSILKAINAVKKAHPKATGAELKTLVDADEGVQKAIKAAQEATAAYVIGAAKGPTSGTSRKRDAETLSTLRNKGAELSEDELIVEYVRLGIPLMPAARTIADKLVKAGKLVQAGTGYALPAA